MIQRLKGARVKISLISTLLMVVMAATAPDITCVFKVVIPAAEKKQYQLYISFPREQNLPGNQWRADQSSITGVLGDGRKEESPVL